MQVESKNQIMFVGGVFLQVFILQAWLYISNEQHCTAAQNNTFPLTGKQPFSDVRNMALRLWNPVRNMQWHISMETF